VRQPVIAGHVCADRNVRQPLRTEPNHQLSLDDFDAIVGAPEKAKGSRRTPGRYSSRSARPPGRERMRRSAGHGQGRWSPLRDREGSACPRHRDEHITGRADLRAMLIFINSHIYILQSDNALPMHGGLPLLPRWRSRRIHNRS